MTRRSSSPRNRVMRVARKYLLIQKAGGACQICGYKKNLASLAFHHIDEKGTRLSGTFLVQLSIPGAEEELSRCVLVCHNCHNEIHNPLLTLKSVSKMVKALTSKKITQEQAHAQFFKPMKRKRK